MESREQPSEAREQDPPQRALAPFLKISLVIALLAGAVGYLIFGSSASDAFVYSKMVDEVMTKPSNFMGRELRVEGQLKPGSVKFREEPCEWRFVVEKASREMPVQFPQCVVPDTFRDGMGISVVVQGKLATSGDSFVANQVIPRCPSKYEMQERKKNGETMPHSQPLSAASEDLAR